MPLETDQPEALAALNSSIFHWDQHLCAEAGELEHLQKAVYAMARYRQLGGTEYVETERSMLAAYKNVSYNNEYNSEHQSS